MTRWLLITLAVDVGVLIVGLILQHPYLRHLRLHQRPFWEEMSRQAPRSWGLFKGMPTTGLLISTIITEPGFREQEPMRLYLMGWLIVVLNIVHGLLLIAIVLMAGAMFLLS